MVGALAYLASTSLQGLLRTKNRKWIFLKLHLLQVECKCYVKGAGELFDSGTGFRVSLCFAFLGVWRAGNPSSPLLPHLAFCVDGLGCICLAQVGCMLVRGSGKNTF